MVKISDMQRLFCSIFITSIPLIFVACTTQQPRGSAEVSSKVGRGVLTASREPEVRFYCVALECPAAPKIGCGSAAKPILLELEKQPAIREAWLNREGTVIAVVPQEKTNPKESTRSVARVLKSHNHPANEITAAEREQIVQGFKARGGWLRGAQVDQLSMEEARIIADRMLRRVQHKTLITDDQTKRLRNEFQQLIEARFIRNVGPSSRDEWREKALQAARPVLDHSQLAALEDALQQGFHPQPGEE